MEAQTLMGFPLFRGMDGEELRAALEALRAIPREYGRGAVILSAGSPTESLGLVLEGSARVESSDAWGNRAILSHIGRGQLFAETYALLEGEPLLVDVAANEDCRVLFLRIGSLGEISAVGTPWAAKLIANLLAVCARKNLDLSGRSFHTSPKTVRGRVMAYLNSVSLQQGGREFDIPFDRQQLADYLNVDRTALSKELGRMRRDGIIAVRKNHFALRVCGP